MNAEFSTDIEPSVEHGNYYYKLTQEMIHSFKSHNIAEQEDEKND